MSSQNSFLLAPAASPSIVGSDADETFTAPNQNTTINGMGGSGDDTLQGGDGDDVFGGNSGAELIWNTVRGGVLAYIDINSDKKADYAIFFEGKRSLAAQDFGLQG